VPRIPSTPKRACVWYDLIADRLTEKLGNAYPTTASGPAVEEYRNKLQAAQAEHREFVEAWHGGDPEQIVPRPKAGAHVHNHPLLAG
jgi:hypothetical protein